TLLMLTRVNVVHALLYLIVSLLAVAVGFYTLGAPFVAALEVIVYAGALMVLFVFVGMMLNLGEHGVEVEKQWLTPGNLDRSCASSQHPYYSSLLFGARQHCRLGHWRRGTEGSWHSPVRSLPDWRGASLHAFAGRLGGRVSPGLPQSRKTGDSIWQIYR